MVHLPDDVVFVERAVAVARASGLMQRPRFDRVACQLVEGQLHVDLLSPWHETRQLTRPDTEQILERWARPQYLAHACSFGRLDRVRAAVAAKEPLDGDRDHGNPIAAAIAAWVVTPLHLACIETLFAAGASATLDQFDAFTAESVGGELDAAIRSLLIAHGQASEDPAVRAKAQAWSAPADA